MQIETRHGPSGTAAYCHLSRGEILRSESGALMGMRGRLNVQTTTHQKKGGGIFSGLKRLLSGESFFINQFEALDDRTEVWLSTPLPGDILVHSLKGEKLVIAGGGFVACSDDVHMDFEWQGLKSVFSGEGLFWIKAQGTGQVILSSFGMIYPIDVQDEYWVDTGHIVAFEDSLRFEITKSTRGWISAFLSGEGLICRFKGRGRVWCQSHNPSAFGTELTPELRPRRQS